MKRSEINKYQKDAVCFLKKHNFLLPAWTFWTGEEWRQKTGSDYDEIKECNLGWDITDFGSGEFEKIGLLLFTIRNGRLDNDKYKKIYAEKIMIVGVDQITPTHFHWKKSEDIINRGGGDLKVQVWKATEDEKLSEEPFTVQMDGIRVAVMPGQILTLKPGDSITMEPYIYHNFYSKKEKTLVGEVSAVNDDTNDNRFYTPAGRFPEIEENEPLLYPLCTEYKHICG